jgi:poly-beta-1,6-N-acetyl-D-glucosamine N-deacetylase
MRTLIYTALNLFSPIFNKALQNRLRVLAYHDIIDANNFESQLIWLKSKYTLIDVPTLKEHLFNNQELPLNPLLITLDDGDKTVYTKGLPILKKHNIPSCLFIITDLIDTNKDFWWNTIRLNEEKNQLSRIEIMDIINKNKAMPNWERLKFIRNYEVTYQEQLTIEEIKELFNSGMFIGNHSHTHPMFNNLEKEEVIQELQESKKFFEWNKIGDHKVFAYPNGNFSIESEKLLENNGIKIAFLFDHQINKGKINPLRISRVAVDSDTPLTEFKSKVSGVHPMIRTIQKDF